MKSRLIDPRDANLKDDVPTYRVYFRADDASGKKEWELSETDLDDVLQWIHQQWAVT